MNGQRELLWKHNRVLVRHKQEGKNVGEGVGTVVVTFNHRTLEAGMGRSLSFMTSFAYTVKIVTSKPLGAR